MQRTVKSAVSLRYTLLLTAVDVKRCPQAKKFARGNTMSDKPVSLESAPEGYGDWLAQLKGRIHNAQQQASLAVNRELVLLYWRIGRDILERQAEQGWGAKVVDRLAHDL